MFKNLLVVNKFVSISNTIKNIIYNKITYASIVKLGRWKIEDNETKTYIKFDSANEDHCGSCNYTIKN